MCFFFFFFLLLGAQGLLLDLNSETTPGIVQEIKKMPGIKSRSATCKANALLAAL